MKGGLLYLVDGVGNNSAATQEARERSDRLVREAEQRSKYGFYIVL
jgi:hypothetical protein